MNKILHLIFDLLSRKYQKTIYLEKQQGLFWSSLLTPARTSESIFYFFSYQQADIKHSILQIKLNGNYKLLGHLMTAMHDILLEELSELFVIKNFSPEVMVGIPSSSQHKSFNQSEAIAESLHSFLSIRSIVYKKGLLTKTKRTPLQHLLGRNARIKNIAHSMAVTNPKVVNGKDILVIDDVTTTGATFTEAIRTLKAAGARHVICIALAH